MQLLFQDDPRRVGPFVLVAGLDEAESQSRAGERRFIARSAEGDRTVLLALPVREAHPDSGRLARFRSEAEQAQKIGGAVYGLAPVQEVSPPDEALPWRTCAYTPALSLPHALSAHGGPLPVRTVKAIGAVLAEALMQLHGQGFAHAGVAPGAVLLGGEGIRLTNFGAVRVAAPDGEDRSGVPGLVAESVPPEQLSGGRPRPLGDIYALGVVLSYAATGHMIAERAELPSELRALVGSCLARDPARRPPAAAVLEELSSNPAVTTGHGSGSSGAPATVPDSAVSRASALLSPGWLPKRICVALGEQASEVLATETELQLDETTVGADAPTAESATTTAPHKGQEPASGVGYGTTAVPTHVDPNQSGPSRRVLMTVAASGATGVTVGGAVTWMATTKEVPPPTVAQRLAAQQTSKKRLKGAPPTPRWSFEVPGTAPRHSPLIHGGGRVVVMANKSAVLGVALSSGKQLWKLSKVDVSGPPRIIEDGLVLVPAADMLALDVRTGAIRWRSKKFRRGGAAPYASVLAADAGTIWFSINDNGAGDSGQGGTVVAFDVPRREELWRSRVPTGVSEGHLSKETLLITARGGSSTPDQLVGEFVALDRRTGKVRWRRRLGGVSARRTVTTFSNGRLILADGPTLHGYSLDKGSKPLWSVRSGGKGDPQKPPFGPPVVSGDLAFCTDASHGVRAVDSEGDVKWRAALDWAWEKQDRPPDTLITPSGRLVLSLDESGVVACDGRSGTPLWRFLDQPDAERGAVTWRRAAVDDETAVVISRNRAYALPLD